MSSLTLKVLAILISAVVYSYAENSTNSNLTKCLSSLNEVERELSSKIPPLKGLTSDNWRNISRALFPALKQPSLYIKVTLRIISNQTVYEVKKFTWAESCAFVTDVFIDAATVFSLGTLWPQRRQAELDLTVHRLCNKSQILKENGFKDENEAWRYVLLTLQDIAILPNLSDPRVNTAQCVVVGHEGDDEQPIETPDWYNWRGCKIAVASIPFAIAIYWFAKILFDKPDNILLSKTSLVLTLICLILMIVEFIYYLILLIISKTHVCHSWPTLLVIILYILSCIIFLIIPLICKKCEDHPSEDDDNQPLRTTGADNLSEGQNTNKHDCCKCEKLTNWVHECINKCTKCETQCKWKILSFIGSYFMLACTYQIVYHLLWVLCGGIPADPSWALPLFLCECVLVLAVFSAIYSCCENEKLLGHPLFSIFAAGVVIVTIVFSFYGSRVDEQIGNVLVIAITAVLLWFYKDSRAFNRSPKKRAQK